MHEVWSIPIRKGKMYLYTPSLEMKRTEMVNDIIYLNKIRINRSISIILLSNIGKYFSFSDYFDSP